MTEILENTATGNEFYKIRTNNRNAVIISEAEWEIPTGALGECFKKRQIEDNQKPRSKLTGFLTLAAFVKVPWTYDSLPAGIKLLQKLLCHFTPYPFCYNNVDFCNVMW